MLRHPVSHPKKCFYTKCRILAQCARWPNSLPRIVIQRAKREYFEVTFKYESRKAFKKVFLYAKGGFEGASKKQLT